MRLESMIFLCSENAYGHVIYFENHSLMFRYATIVSGAVCEHLQEITKLIVVCHYNFKKESQITVPKLRLSDNQLVMKVH